MLKRTIALLLALCLCAGLQVAVLAEGTGWFILDGPGKDSTLCAPLVLPSGNLVIAVSTRGGLASMNYEPSGPRRTWIACFSPGRSLRWETAMRGDVTLCGLDAAGNVQVVQRTYGAESNAFCPVLLDAATGRELSRGGVLSAPKFSEEGPLRYNWAMAEHLMAMVTEDPGAACKPRYYRLFDYETGEMWSLSAEELGLELMADAVELPDGVVLLWSEGDCPAAVKLGWDGTVLWRYQADGLGTGAFTSGWLNADGNVALLGSVQTVDAAACALVTLDAQTGLPLWETTVHLDGDCAEGTAMAAGAAVVAWEDARHAVACAAYDAGGALLATWSVPLEQSLRCMAVEPFFWQGRLWAQCVVETGEDSEVFYLALDGEKD